MLRQRQQQAQALLGLMQQLCRLGLTLAMQIELMTYRSQPALHVLLCRTAHQHDSGYSVGGHPAIGHILMMTLTGPFPQRLLSTRHQGYAALVSSVRPPSDRSPLGPGTLLSATERYVISEYLAEGGMGAIYLGKRISVGGFEKQVVLKQLLPEFSNDQQITELFLQEARLSASLNHQNIVQTIDLVRVMGSYYMVMEYVRGADLRTLLRRCRRRGKRLSPAAALLIGRDMLDALDYAHGKCMSDGSQLGLVHRDISPSNILLSAQGEVKLTDFGIAQAAAQAPSRYKVRGKVGYMSPEQARGEDLDARSDLFSLAVILYEVLCGERLFVGNLTHSPAMIYQAPIAPPSCFCPDLPGEVDDVLLKALSLQPAQRYQNARAFSQALTELALGHRLLLGRQEMADQLLAVCGQDPATWLHDEERTGTAMIAPGGADDDDFDLSDEAAAADDPDEHVIPAAPAKAKGAHGNDEVEDVTTAFERAPLLPDTTQPMEKQSLPIGIAYMARKMLPDQTAAKHLPRSLSSSAQRAKDDTSALSDLHPSATQRMAALSKTDLGPPSGLGQATGRLSSRYATRQILVLGLLVVVLIGAGVLLGVAFSGPRYESTVPRPVPQTGGGRGPSQ